MYEPASVDLAEQYQYEEPLMYDIEAQWNENPIYMDDNYDFYPEDDGVYNEWDNDIIDAPIFSRNEYEFDGEEQVDIDGKFVLEDDNFTDENMSIDAISVANNDDEWDLTSTVTDDETDTEIMSEIEGTDSDSDTNEEIDITYNTEDVSICEMYDRWVSTQYETSAQKFGLFDDECGLGELYTKYRDHHNELNRIPKFYYHNSILQTIKEEIDETYDILVADFLVRVFVDCEYRLKHEDDEMIVCNTDRMELFTLRDYVMKYLVLIDRASQYDTIISLVSNSHKIPHIANVSYIEAHPHSISYEYIDQMVIGDKMKQD
jgi:hypothetical protein